MALVEKKEVEKTERLWSDPKSWTSGKVPLAGEDVEVEPGWNMIFDLGSDSPVFNHINLNGKLTFKNDTKAGEIIHLKAHRIFVRAGELHIGSKEYPYQGEARVSLHGAKDAEAMVYDNGVEAGSKIIANVGLVSMYGKSRFRNVARLRAETLKGQQYIMTDPGLDLVKGDRLGIAPTGYYNQAYDDIVVDKYDNETGRVDFLSKIQTYHFGAPVSTAAKYNGVDIRGEVIVLGRNIQIDGDQTNGGAGWGCQILTGDLIESDLSIRQGRLMLDNVEIRNGSQIDTEKSSIRFEGHAGPFSSVTNVSIHNGLSWGMTIKESANVIVKDSTMFRHQAFGISIQTSRNVTLDGNVLAAIIPRVTDIDPMAGVIDKGGGIAVCS